MIKKVSRLLVDKVSGGIGNDGKNENHSNTLLVKYRAMAPHWIIREWVVPTTEVDRIINAMPTMELFTDEDDRRFGEYDLATYSTDRPLTHRLNSDGTALVPV